jgi:hypothetical protein
VLRCVFRVSFNTRIFVYCGVQYKRDLTFF